MAISRLKFHIYKDRLGEWRWRLMTRNGKILANSGEGYKRRRSLFHAIGLIRKGAATTYAEQMESSGRFERSEFTGEE